MHPILTGIVLTQEFRPQWDEWESQWGMKNLFCHVPGPRTGKWEWECASAGVGECFRIAMSILSRPSLSVMFRSATDSTTERENREKREAPGYGFRHHHRQGAAALIAPTSPASCVSCSGPTLHYGVSSWIHLTPALPFPSPSSLVFRPCRALPSPLSSAVTF